MESGVVPKLDPVLKRFTYWSVEMVQALDMSGWVAVRNLRPGVKRSTDLRTEERRELYDKIVPRLERMINAVVGPGIITHQWTGSALYLIPPRAADESADLHAEYHRILQAAAA
jgi:hypothetical protein